MLATCIMPTHDRRAFVPRAIDSFLSQDIDAIELVILDDGADAVRDLVPEHPRIRYLSHPRKLSLGAKRNALGREARGAVIVHWDDDDWYPPWRVRVQLEALRSRDADACGSRTTWYHEPATGRAWRYEYRGADAYVTGNTLAYRKAFWEQNPFAEVQVGEDTRFVRSVPRGRLVDLADPGLCVATVHPGNVSPKRPASSAWTRVDPDALPSARGADGQPQRSPRLPRVSCIMPTADRRPFVTLALELFAAQTLLDRELVVVDDGDDPVGDLCEGAPGVRYLRLPQKMSIGAKRNVACQSATGALIAHWDDDDWYGPERLRLQAEPIAAGRADVTGLENAYTLKLPEGEFWGTSRRLHQRMFVEDVHGGTLMFRRSLFEGGVRYPDANLAEDAALLRALTTRGARLERVGNGGVFVYVRHGRNAWRFDAGRFLDISGWRRVEAPPTMPHAAVERYRAAASGAARARDVPPPAGRDAFRDCLDAANVTLPDAPLRAERCVAVVAGEGQARLLDALLDSIERRGCIPDALKVVFIEGVSPGCERVAAQHRAEVVRCRATRAPSPALKGALYSMARAVDARQYLCLDADLLVLDSLAELFEQHARLPAGKVLIAPESMPGRPVSLGAALTSIYHGTAGEIASLTRGDPALAAYPHVVNDGLFVADRVGLEAVDGWLRSSAGIVQWVHGRRDVGWRQKAALNLALASIGADVALDPSYNVQLHAERAEPDGGSGARWRGGRARVLHFNGAGRRLHAAWCTRLR
ncbi:glycosyltransferase family 2 protein [Sorangium sp. So ce726]|uniref:glycosyltransferase family 2 protein n=1 Tax=Sorangium sp. So ce726 TaxID=3133319 RepID=UPI003F5D7788